LASLLGLVETPGKQQFEPVSGQIPVDCPLRKRLPPWITYHSLGVFERNPGGNLETLRHVSTGSRKPVKERYIDACRPAGTNNRTNYHRPLID
jgi:hypothetical protein